MAEILELVDLDELRKEVREKYREVAQDPAAEYHFHTGRAHAIRLGYPTTQKDQSLRPSPAWATRSSGVAPSRAKE